MLCCAVTIYVSMRPISCCVSFFGGNSTPRLDLPVCTASLIIGLFCMEKRLCFHSLVSNIWANQMLCRETTFSESEH